jgi:hypothetical protein
MPHLAAAMANYNFTAQAPLYIATFGSSIALSGGGYTDPANQAACGYLVSDLKKWFPGPGGLGYNFQCVNMGMNGAIAYQFPAAWIEYSTYALKTVTINTTNTGGTCVVGDYLTVNQGATTQGGAVVVTGCSGSQVSSIAVSPFPGCLTDADTYTPSTSLYSLASNVPTLNGPPPNCGIYEPVGNETGLTVNITAVGYPTPTVGVLQWGMNDSGPLLYNTGETLSGMVSAVIGAVTTLEQSSADPIIFTSHHPSIMWNYYVQGNSQWAWNTLIGCAWPDFMTICSPTTPGNTSQVDYVHSTWTGDLAHAGTPVSVSARVGVINQNFRNIASNNLVSVIDAEQYWFDLLETTTAAQTPITTTASASSGSTTITVASNTGLVIGNPITGTGIQPNTSITAISGTTVTLSLPTIAVLSSTPISAPNQLAAEQTLFPAHGPHINLAGEQAYDNAIDDFVSALASQTSQPAAGTAATQAGVSAINALVSRGAASTYQLPGIAQGSGYWFLLGTWTANSNGTALGVVFNTTNGYATNENNAAVGSLEIIQGNGGTAPSISGITTFCWGGGGTGCPVGQAKAVAHGGSTSPANKVWDVYVNMGPYATGTYSVTTAPADSWVSINSLSTNPGAASTTIFAGNVYVPPITLTTTGTSGPATLVNGVLNIPVY